MTGASYVRQLRSLNAGIARINKRRLPTKDREVTLSRLCLGIAGPPKLRAYIRALPAVKAGDFS